MGFPVAFEILRPLDRFAAGRHASYRVDTELVDHPRVARTFRGVRRMLMAEVGVGVLALSLAVFLLATGQNVPWVVWFRCSAVLAITLTLFYFLQRASEGYYWAYSRLRMFSWIFPIVTLIVGCIPNLYPLWIIVEQAVFALILIGIGDLLSSKHMRLAFPKPERRSRD